MLGLNVLGQIELEIGSMWAVRAFKGLYPSVDDSMSPTVLRIVECLATSRAAKDLVCGLGWPRGAHLLPTARGSNS